MFIWCVPCDGRIGLRQQLTLDYKMQRDWRYVSCTQQKLRSLEGQAEAEETDEHSALVITLVNISLQQPAATIPCSSTTATILFKTGRHERGRNRR